MTPTEESLTFLLKLLGAHGLNSGSHRSLTLVVFMLGFERKCEGKFFHTVIVPYLLACHAAVKVSIPRRFHSP